ncbi:MerR family transcriptional regulator [Companilactobacillus furfuricola]|uniref:MerR family transcriptional regulator n=1 Tax=Companilactobacillus furfuricola TaxID=1462575 RepID=UPI000F77734E|nr:MerR family transcriptional regulator [Companilactobacillus furfuricola]
MATYSVQQVANKTGLTTYTVRYYHDHGLLPFVQRDKNNNRVFSDSDIEWLEMITCLRSTGMPIDQIKNYTDLVVEGENTVPERYQIMLNQQKRTVNEIKELQQHLATIKYKVDHYAEIMENHEPDSFEPSNIRDKENLKTEAK